MKTSTAGVDDLSLVVAAVSARSAKRQGLRWFVRAPARMALDSGLSAVAFRLATVLLHYEGELGCFPSQERLSTDLGISVDSVQRYLRELELYGFLIVEKRGRRNNYRLEPIYEAPIGHGSIEETGQLEVENLPKRRPPQPRSLRARTPVETAKISASEHAAPVRSITHGTSGSQIAAPVRSIGTPDVGSVPWSGDSLTLRRIAHAALVVIG
jgi:biotin operon repressor